jgi:hypothetical protein
MAPLDQYLMKDRNAEIALARSAAPEAISRDATVMVLAEHGYVTAVGLSAASGFIPLLSQILTRDKTWSFVIQV